ncbi:hypothetical protein [Hydrogenimonas sp.]
MAIVGYYKNEQISSNDTSLCEGILSQLEELKAIAPDKFEGDINLADYALLFTAMAEKAGGKKVKLSINATRSILIDGTTNTKQKGS